MIPQNKPVRSPRSPAPSPSHAVFHLCVFEENPTCTSLSLCFLGGGPERDKTLQASLEAEPHTLHTLLSFWLNRIRSSKRKHSPRSGSHQANGH